MEWSIDPTLVSIGSFAIRWYSLFFAGGFLVGFFIVQRMFQAEGKSEKHLDYILMVSVIGTLVGARLGHCLLYEPATYLADPLRILNIREGGLASHGGFAGVIIALIIYCRRHADIPFFWLADRLTIPTMIEATMIRLGNFFNSEIYGHPTSVPWAVTFLRDDTIPRHPTQLYEAFGYACVAIFAYWYYRKHDRKPDEGRLLGIALAVSFTWRIFVEFFKENQVAFEEGMLFNMGQLLSIPFILLGLWLALGKHQKVSFLQGGLTQPASEAQTTKPEKGKSLRKRKKR